MTAYSELKVRARANAHDISDPSASVSGKDVNERALARRPVQVRVEADAAAGTTIAERTCLGFPASQYPNGVEIKEIKMRSAAITPHADNHATDTFIGRDVNGINNLTVATLTTDADVAIGAGGLGAGASTAFKEYEALLSATVANRVVSAGGCLTLTRAKAGTGVQLAVVEYTVVFEAL